MKINVFAQKWCRSDYEPKNESFYIANAKYVINRGWLKGTIIHSIIAIVAIVSASILFKGSVADIGYCLGAAALSFVLYGINQYWFDNVVSGLFVYGFVFGFLIWTKFKLPSLILWIAAIVGIVLFAGSAFIILKRVLAERKAYLKLAEKADEDMDKQAADDFKDWKDRFYSHDNDDYYNYDSSETYYDTHREDPLVEQAIKLFEGYLTNKTIFKKRYRELAKQYHPDLATGNEELFKRIVTYYEDMKDRIPD